MTKKQAYKLIEKKYSNYGEKKYDYIGPLCICLPFKLRKDWKKYWYNIETSGWYNSISDFVDIKNLSLKDYDTVVSLTRLHILHDFIEDTYK